MDNLQNLTTSRLTRKYGRGPLIYSEENATIECVCTTNQRQDNTLIGKSYQYFTTCTVCGGYGKILTKSRAGLDKWCMCKSCKGNGIHSFNKPIITGPCKICNGDLKHNKINMYDTVCKEDLLKLYKIIDFNEVFTVEKLSFNESFIGIYTITGEDNVLKLERFTTRKLKTVIKSKFLDIKVPYKLFLNKDKEVCDKLIIKKTTTSWRIIPEWKIKELKK